MYNEATLEQMHDYLKNFIEEEKRRDVIPDYLKILREKIKITKNVDIIHRFYDTIINKEEIH